MKINWKNAIFTLANGLFIGGSAYICGHAVAMHQHTSLAEQNKMIRDENGNLNKKKYIFEAFKDYKRMIDDPLGFERELD